MMELAVRNISSNIYIHLRDLRYIEDKTISEATTANDYKGMVRNISTITIKVLEQLTALRVNLLRLKALDEQIKSMDKSLPEEYEKRLWPHSFNLHSRIGLVISGIENMLLLHGNIEERLRSQQAVVSLTSNLDYSPH